MALFVWMIAIAAVLAGLLVTAAAHMPYVHMAIAGAGGLAVAGAAIMENRALRASGAAEATVASSTARHMAVVWIVGAIALLLTYNFALSWKEWWQFFAAFAVVGAVCVAFAAGLAKDAASGRTDGTMSSLGRTATIVVLVGMIVTMAGLLIDGKMTRFLVRRYTDWAANNIFFFGALGLAIVAAYALRASGRKDARS